MHSNGTAPPKEPQTQTLPYSQEAEEAVLGSILIDPDAFYEIDLLISADDFHQTAHKRIYKAMSDLYAEKLPVDNVTVCELLHKRYQDGMEAEVMGLVMAVPTSINASAYARIVESDAMRRRLIVAGDKIIKGAANGKKSVDKLVEASEQAIFEVTQKSATKNVTTIKSGMSRLVDVTMERRENGHAPGIMSGWTDFDNLVKGFKKQRLYIMAGRPGMGKSIAERNIACHAASQGYRVASFNLEMGLESILQRSISAQSKIPFGKVEDGKLTDSELMHFNRTAGEMSEWPMWIDDTAGLSLSQLTAKCRRLQAEHGLDMITIDYLTLMSVDSGYGNRTQDVGAISRGLKRLSKDLDVPVIALAQLSRQCEQRQDKHPMLSDLRDSGEIEQDADAVIFLYRDEYYNPDTTARPNIVEFNLAKHRHGATGTVDLFYHRQIMKFDNLKRDEINL